MKLAALKSMILSANVRTLTLQYHLYVTHILLVPYVRLHNQRVMQMQMLSVASCFKALIQAPDIKSTITKPDSITFLNHQDTDIQIINIINHLRDP